MTQLLTDQECDEAGLERGVHVSDGDTTCCRCDGLVTIPEGAPVYWTNPGYMEPEQDPYCLACARERARTTRVAMEALDAKIEAMRQRGEL